MRFVKHDEAEHLFSGAMQLVGDLLHTLKKVIERTDDTVLLDEITAALEEATYDLAVLNVLVAKLETYMVKGTSDAKLN